MKNITYSLACVLLITCGLSSLTSCKNNGDDPTPTPTPTTVVDSLRIGLIAYYPLNNSGADSSGKGNDVAYYSNMTPAVNRFGKANSAFYFDGVTSYMVVKDNTALRLNNTDFTVSAWVKPDALNAGNGSYIIVKRTSGVDSAWGFNITGMAAGLPASGKIFFGPGGNGINTLSINSITVNNWSLVTVTYSLSKKQINTYINGVLDNVTNNVPSPDATTTADMYIGRDNPNPATGYFYKGTYDEIRIYNRMLTTKEVQKLFVTAL